MLSFQLAFSHILFCTGKARGSCSPVLLYPNITQREQLMSWKTFWKEVHEQQGLAETLGKMRADCIALKLEICNKKIIRMFLYV